MHNKLIVLLLLSILILPPAQSAAAAPGAAVTNDGASLSFPDTVTFHANLQAASSITSVILEYGDQQETCGQVTAEAFPQFTPASTVSVQWTWDMRQSGSLPPGSQIWWRWRYTDSSGHETLSDQQTVTWLDSIHKWQTLIEGDIRLHLYQNNTGFAKKLLDNAYNGLARVEQDAGLSTDQPIDMYIYADTNDMQEAILYEPAWTGGEAFPEHNIVIIGISPSDLIWGLRAEVHELTHVVVGHLTFSCLGVVPTWLNEGLAVYSEGDLQADSQTQLNQAIKSDQLLSVRSLSVGFSEVPSQAYLSYSESYSIVKFLITTYGRDKMTALLLALRDGNTVDAALTKVYGFNIEGLEDAWRQNIGAAPRSAASNPTPVVTPTDVPTIVPVSGELAAITPTPFVVPATSVPTDAPTGPPLSLTITLLCTICSLGVVIGVIVLGFVLAMQKNKGDQNEKKS
jgi:hypothetical protein